MAKGKGKAKMILMWVLTGLFLVLNIVAIVGASIANYYSATINSYLNLLPYKTEEIGEDEVQDTEYYKSSFVTSNGNFDDEALYDYDLRVSEQIVSEGVVLLWNNDIGGGKKALPLDEGERVDLFSTTSVKMVHTGTGSGSISVSNAVDLRTSMEKYEFEVNETLWNFYKTGAGSSYGIQQKGSAGIAQDDPLYIHEAPWSLLMSSGVDASFKAGDTAIFVLGRSGGEGGDLRDYNVQIDTIDHDYLQLAQEEKDIFDEIVKKKGTTFERFVVLINSANALNMDLLYKEYGSKIDACLWVGQPGAGGAPGIAKVLAGKANPSGRLVDTYVYDNNSAPAMTNFYLHTYKGDISGLDSTQYAYTVYQEGIYIGYKYYETRYEDVVLGQDNAGEYSYADTVAFPFGYGLSYSTFRYDNFSVTENDKGDYTVKVRVTNTGDTAGRYVAQIYLQKPYTDYDKQHGIEKSAVELAGYDKTGILAKGASAELTITVDDRALTVYDAEGTYGGEQGGYILEGGDYYFAVGDGAHDALNNILAAKKGDAKYASSVDTSKMVDNYGKPATGNADLAGKVTIAETDDKSYLNSVYTETRIRNRFDFVNINTYQHKGSNAVTYLTRNDWTGTMPKAAPELTITDGMRSHLAFARDLPEAAAAAQAYYKENGYDYENGKKIKYDQKNGLTLVQFRELPFGDAGWEKLLDQMTWLEQAELCSNGYHTTAPVESIAKPGTRDENGPLGISVTFSTMQARASMGWPCEPTRAATFNKKLSELFGKCVGEDMLHAGVTGLWGYGLNIHRTAYSGRNFEYYSEDSFLSGETCSYETRGTQSKGAFVMVKHFVANDAETQRHGNNEWMTEQTLREIYLAPFEKEFTEGGARSTMTSYNRLGCEWTGGCYALLTDVLRGEWGYEGYCSSDYAGGTRGKTYYQNVYIGIQAGCDTYDANFHADEYTNMGIGAGDPVFDYCLRISSKRICNSIVHTAVMNGIKSTTRVVWVNTWWQNALIGVEAGTGVLTVAFLALGILFTVRYKKSKGGATA